MSSRTAALYANVGPVLTQYDIDVEAATLTPRSSVTLPASIQYCWPSADRKILYIATSSSASGYGPKGTDHHISAYRIDAETGALSQHGDPIRIPVRPIHMTTDIPSRHILVCYNDPSLLEVYRINDDGTPGALVKQSEPMDFGIFAHQVRVTPDNKRVILVTRGNEGTAQRAEEPGALKIWNYTDGILSNEVSVAPNGGREFGPRHLDFHPTRPWIYVSIETQNQMMMFRMENGSVVPDVQYTKTTLLEPDNIRARQAASTVHVHPNGRFVYGANRSQATVEYKGQPVYKGGENSIVVYAIDQATGEPTAIQHIETQAIHPRTFHIHPSGRLMAVQHNKPVNVREGDDIRTVPAGLSVFRIRDDGKLDFVRKYDVDVGEKLMFWMGMVEL